MSDFELRRESIEERLDYSVLVSEFENGVSQRRLRHPKKVIGFSIKTPPLTYAQMTEYRNFVVTKYGALTSFTFTSPFDGVEYDVIFEPGSFRTSFAGGVYQCTFQFKVV